MNNNNKKYIYEVDNPTNADPIAKNLAQRYINNYIEQKSLVENPLEEARNGTICSGQKRNIENYNDAISRGVPGQAIEIHGHRETKTVMAKFEQEDGALAHEVLTSAATPPNTEDREEYYDDFYPVFGERDESFITRQPQEENNTTSEEEDSISETTDPQMENATTEPSAIEGENITTEPLANEEQNILDNSNDNKNIGLSEITNSVEGKRKLEDSSDEHINKRSKKNNDDDDDDDEKGSGPTAGESSGNASTNLSNISGGFNFKTSFENASFILINIIASIIDGINDIFT